MKKDRYCKNCGALVDNSLKKCTGCGRQFFKFNKHMFFMVLMLIALAISIAVNIIQAANKTVIYQNWQNTESDLQEYALKAASLQNENSQLQDEKRQLNEKIDKLQVETEQLNDEIGELQAKTEQLNNEIDGLRNKPQTPAVTAGQQQSPTSVYTEPNSKKNTCLFANCNTSISGRNIYCYAHKCSNAGCLNPKGTLYGLYCTNHTCNMPNCTSGKAYNNAHYCLVHAR